MTGALILGGGTDLVMSYCSYRLIVYLIWQDERRRKPTDYNDSDHAHRDEPHGDYVPFAVFLGVAWPMSLPIVAVLMLGRLKSGRLARAEKRRTARLVAKAAGDGAA